MPSEPTPSILIKFISPLMYYQYSKATTEANTDCQDNRPQNVATYLHKKYHFIVFYVNN